MTLITNDLPLCFESINLNGLPQHRSTFVDQIKTKLSREYLTALRYKWKLKVVIGNHNSFNKIPSVDQIYKLYSPKQHVYTVTQIKTIT